MKVEFIKGVGCRIVKQELVHYFYLDGIGKFKLINGKIVVLNRERKFNGFTIDEMKLLF